MQKGVRVDRLEPYLDARDLDTLWAQLHRDLEHHGIERVFHARALRRPANGDLAARDAMVLSSYGAEFDRYFVDGGAFLSDVTTQWALDSEGAVSWSLTSRLKARGQLTSRQLNVHEKSRALGIRSGYTVSLRPPRTSLVSGFGLCADRAVPQARVDRIWQEEGVFMVACLRAFDTRARDLPQPPAEEELSARQREVLEWAGEGKTIDDIAHILSLHPSTVAKHMHEARMLLGVATTLQAVLRATIQGQIYR